jgi:hypothetical protein
MLRNTWPIAAVSLCFSVGCNDNDDFRYGEGPGGPRVTGQLELRWSIEDSTEAEACEAINAVEFETIVSDNFWFTEFEADCAEFTAPMTLAVGDYVARSRLVDESDRTITHRVVLDRIRILEDEVTVLSIDFPSEFVVAPIDEADAGAPPPEEEPDAEVPPPEEGEEEDVVDAGAGDAAPAEEPAPDAAAPDAAAP